MRSARRVPAAGLLVMLCVVVAMAAAACGPSVTSSPSAASSPSLSPTTTAAAPGTSAAGSAGPTAPVAIDPSLLDILPETVDGLAVVESPEAEAAALADPELATVGTALVAGIAVDLSTGAFVFAAVVRLIPGVMDEGTFRDWRDSFDEGACSQASGIAGNAQAEIDGRTVYIGTCAGGARTYHVWLEAQGIIVSASAVGERRLGEKLMENLRVP